MAHEAKLGDRVRAVAIPKNWDFRHMKGACGVLVRKQNDGPRHRRIRFDGGFVTSRWGNGTPGVADLRLGVLPRFRCGDRVKLIGYPFQPCCGSGSADSWARGNKGAIGTIADVRHDDGYVEVKWDDPEMKSCRTTPWLMPARFELLASSSKEHTYEVGDRVRLLSVPKNWPKVGLAAHVGTVGTVFGRRWSPSADLEIRLQFGPGGYRSGFVLVGGTIRIEPADDTEPSILPQVTSHDADLLGELIHKGWKEHERCGDRVVMIDASDTYAVLFSVYTGNTGVAKHGPQLKVAHLQHAELYNWPRVMEIPAPVEADEWWHKVRDIHSERHELEKGA